VIERKLKRLVSIVEDFSVGFCWKLFRGLFSEDQKVKQKHLSNVIEKNSELFLPFFRIPFFQNSNFLFQYLRFSKLYFLFQYLRIGDCSNLKWALARSGGRFLLTFCYKLNPFGAGPPKICVFQRTKDKFGKKGIQIFCE
jgi:hypothetical protein